MENVTHNVKSRISYAFGAFGHDLFYTTLSTYFIIFVTSHLFDKSSGTKMIGYITLIILVLRFGELVIDPFIGNTIDKTTTCWGKFKPWVVAGGTVGSIGMILLFTNLGGLNESNPVLYLLIFALLYITVDIFYAFKDIGFWSMIPALTFDSRERERTATYARIGSTIGANIVGIVVMPLVLLFSINKNHGTGDTHGWFVFALIIAVVAFISAIAVALGTKEVDSDLRKNTKSTSIKDVFKVLTKNDQLMWLSLSYVLYTSGIQITMSLELYYFTYILGSATHFSILATLNTIVGLLSVSAFPALANKFNRRNVYFLSIGVMILGLLLFAVAGKSLLVVLIAAELFFVPQPLIFLVVLMTLTDSVEYGQLKLGHRDESLTLSVRPLLDKFGGAVSNGIVGLTAVWAGMTTGASAGTITSTGRFTFKIMMFAIPLALIIAGSIVFFKKVTLDEKAHAKIVDQLEKVWGKDKVDSDNLANPLKPGEYEYYSPVSGELIALSQVADKTFASGSMGKGFAIKPTDGKIFAPFDGVVRVTFPTKHAVGLVSNNGIVTLIHVGINTVQLKGDGFTTYFERGQQVKKGDLLMDFQDKIIKDAKFDDTVMIVIINSNEFTEFDYQRVSGYVGKEDVILRLSKAEK
ncbi:MAG: glycoside-pentoside-hexuronide (GPH):cation symporter [Liquorilactobacillus nagelii]|jgi:lactose/raffinose/galactose permease|uniref:glycoside-pentoside-hexuronide (GPH):cation symporter n=1 Tax=Liquorilactobacillus nagelii TaxID=82688 RepID=UPI00242FAA63|nr:glycoside-pentoside-hexuronide (GPH):cation symporter [Liquorilactobacillus nagelii]MCI1978009.1 glycoside-pentoside-hexuronide (GPH):cation symporter [Liquorilactobacillus nagelii]